MPSTINPYLIGVWFCVGFFTGAGWAVAAWLNANTEWALCRPVDAVHDGFTFFLTLQSTGRIARLRNQSLLLCCG